MGLQGACRHAFVGPEIAASQPQLFLLIVAGVRLSSTRIMQLAVVDIRYGRGLDGSSYDWPKTCEWTKVSVSYSRGVVRKSLEPF